MDELRDAADRFAVGEVYSEDPLALDHANKIRELSVREFGQKFAVRAP
ncbi:hypothetical protein JMUB6875_71960 [Nocardia sp. JMUB6875]